jgi:hypothetical protein
MRAHDAELKRLWEFLLVLVALRENGPSGRGARLDANDLEHSPNGARQIAVHIGLVSLADQCFGLK